MISPLTRPLFSLFTSEAGSTSRPVSTDLKETTMLQFVWVSTLSCTIQAKLQAAKVSGNTRVHPDFSKTHCWLSPVTAVSQSKQEFSRCWAEANVLYWMVANCSLVSLKRNKDNDLIPAHVEMCWEEFSSAIKRLNPVLLTLMRSLNSAGSLEHWNRSVFVIFNDYFQCNAANGSQLPWCVMGFSWHHIPPVQVGLLGSPWRTRLPACSQPDLRSWSQTPLRDSRCLEQIARDESWPVRPVNSSGSLTFVLEEHGSRGQSGVAAQIHLRGGREPAKAEPWGWWWHRSVRQVSSQQLITDAEALYF